MDYLRTTSKYSITTIWSIILLNFIVSGTSPYPEIHNLYYHTTATTQQDNKASNFRPQLSIDPSTDLLFSESAENTEPEKTENSSKESRQHFLRINYNLLLQQISIGKIIQLSTVNDRHFRFIKKFLLFHSLREDS